jgi:hypothetical protein
MFDSTRSDYNGPAVRLLLCAECWWFQGATTKRRDRCDPRTHSGCALFVLSAQSSLPWTVPSLVYPSQCTTMATIGASSAGPPRCALNERSKVTPEFSQAVLSEYRHITPAPLALTLVCVCRLRGETQQLTTGAQQFISERVFDHHRVYHSLPGVLPGHPALRPAPTGRAGRNSRLPPTTSSPKA